MNKEEKASSYHEAGHALAAFRFGHYGGTISCVPEGDTLGRSTSEGPSADVSSYIEQIVVLYAGFASESKYYENADRRGSSQDDERAADLLECTSEIESNLRIKAKELIDKNWPIIEAIAETLIVSKALQEDEWTIIIDAFDEGENWEEALRDMRAAIKEFNDR